LSAAIAVIMTRKGCSPERKMLFDSEIEFHATADSRRVFLRIRRDPNKNLAKVRMTASGAKRSLVDLPFDPIEQSATDCA
jgi:hypothetical protein